MMSDCERRNSFPQKHRPGGKPKTRFGAVCGPICFLIAGSFLFAGISFAEEEKSGERIVPEVRAYRINPHAPVIDGALDDPVWKSDKIDFVRGFRQIDPDEGQALTESTVVAVAYDDDALNFAFWCYDSEPEKIAHQLVRRDRWGESDKVQVRLDPYHDHQTGYLFEVSVSNVQRDMRLFDDENVDTDWDGVWESAVKDQPWGWSAEIRIPYHCLRFTKKEKHVWGVDFVRRILRKNEVGNWAFVPAEEGGMVSNFGHLTGLYDIKPARHLEVLPYAVSSLETEPKSAGNPDGRAYPGNLGFDVKYGLSSNLILDAAINPDFGQVELDRPVLNLSTIETYYPEKRPFFLEGSDLFHSEFNLFYSRRIGRPPGWVDDDNLDYYTNRPQATTILGAAKLTGKLAGRTSFAFLNAVTQEESADYVDVLDQSQSAVIEPQANYSAFRIKQDVLSRSSVGGILTLASQDQYHPALTGGIDWRLLTNNGVWGVRGQSVFSRNDDEHVGFGLDAMVEKAAGKHIRGAAGVVIKDPYLNLNRLGYLGRNNTRHGWMWVQYRTQDDWWIVRNSWNNFNMYGSWNYSGANYTRGWNINSHFEFINNWTLGGGFNQSFEDYYDLETRGMGLWEAPRAWSWWASLNTDQRRMFSFNLNPGSGKGRNGSWWANWIGVECRPTANMEFSLGTNYVRDFGETRWVDNPGDTATVFADLDQDEVVLRATASVMFHRNLSCQLSAQGLVVGLDYQNYRPYIGHGNYGSPLSESEFGSYDYNYSALNSTLLIRWEYRPGSTLYLVWTRAQSEFDEMANDLDLKRDFDRLFSGNAENVFLIKASYWLNM